MSSAKGLLATGVPPMPVWIFYLKIAILALSLIVLALAAYSLSVLNFGAGGFLIFIAILSMIVYGADIGLGIAAPQAYFRIGFLIAYSLCIIFWLSAWAWAASEASVWLSWTWNHSSAGGALAGAAALGAVAWVLTIIVLVYFVIGSLKDSSGTSAANQAELGQVKQEPAATEYPAAQYQQAQYTQTEVPQTQYAQAEVPQAQYNQGTPYAPEQQQYTAQQYPVQQ